VLLACALVALGVTALSDFAIRGRARFDPRGATLFLVVGIGALLVMAARVLWG
jgi:hypothetical protein